MSRAFVKDDAPNERLIVPERAPLPEGTPNLVTPRGLELLRAEREALRAEHARLQEGDGVEGERVQRLAVNRARLDDLEERLASARLVAPPDPAPDEVRFGATVVVRAVGGPRAGEESRLTIVGVDEADPDEDRVAFVAPIARALLGLEPGQEARLRVGKRERVLEVVAVAYGDDAGRSGR